MEERDEWCFEFRVAADRPTPREVADELMEGAVCWAEAHRLGIGGGYRPSPCESDGAAPAWMFRFGLCITEDGQSIPRRLAHDLWEALQAKSGRLGARCDGGFREFPVE